MSDGTVISRPKPLVRYRDDGTAAMAHYTNRIARFHAQEVNRAIRQWWETNAA